MMMMDPQLKPYTPLWNKHRPAIVKLMVDSLDTPQQYKLFQHEFKAANSKQKGGYSFVLQMYKGKPINNVRDSVIAQGLLEILQLSKKASELTDESPYEISLDKQFVLRITKMSI